MKLKPAPGNNPIVYCLTILTSHPVMAITSIILSIFWMMLIYYFSSLPAGATGPDTLLFKVISKMSHFVIFGILSILYLFSIKWKKPLKDTGKGVFIFSLLLAVIYAATDEYHQSFTHGRYARLADILLDASGAMTFLAIAYKFRCWRLLNFSAPKADTGT
jgi:VanZ family protein